MENKRILFTEVNKAELITEEIKKPQGKEVLVKLEYSCISNGTERANITGDENVSIVKGKGNLPFPRTGGYSSSGIVTAVGQDVKTVNIGDRVALSWSYHGQYCLTTESLVHKIQYDNVSLKDAAFSHISIFPLAAIRKCHLEIGESAIVMGLGILGMIAVQLLKAAGAYPVIAVDPIKSKRELAIKNGADYVFDPFSDSFAEDVMNLTGGINVAIEVTGNGKALDMVLDCMAKFGRVALLGCTRNSDFTIDYYRKVHGPGISLIGAHTNARPQVNSSSGLWTQKDDINTTLKLLAGSRIDFSKLSAEIHSPKDAPEIYQRLINDKDFPIVQFDWSKI